jgi:hypothetical protein
MTKFLTDGDFSLFFLAKYMFLHILFPMNSTNTSPTPDSLLTQIAAIKRMEAGKISTIRKGPTRSYYNLQHRDNGKNHTQYIPMDQLSQAQANVQAYEQFSDLVEQYVTTVSDISRKERSGEIKKKTPTRTSRLPRKPKSKN